jgi:hypothetical protein
MPRFSKGNRIEDHIVEVTDMIGTGKGGQRRGKAVVVKGSKPAFKKGK